MRHKAWLFRLKRLHNSVRKMTAGLTPRGESVWPGVRNDLFVAHLSIYNFFARYVQGKRILDAGCGAGYGSAKLADAGSEHVLGVDIDPNNIRYAKKHYRRSMLEFRVEDCEKMEPVEEGYDLIVSSNMMEHLRAPERFLELSKRSLSPGGRLILVIPAITHPAMLALNEDISYHRSNKYVDEWLRLFDDHGWDAQCFQHHHPGMYGDLDFLSPWESTVSVDEFEFIQSDRDGLYSEPTLSGVYILQRRSG